MAQSPHFDHHKKEAIVNKRRFSTLTAALAIVLVAIVGSQYHASDAAQTTNPYGTSSYCPNPSSTTLQSGSSGNCVKYLQWDLNHPVNAGPASLTIDGQFGSNTKTAVINYQKARGLSQDGIVGTNTWGQLLAKPVANLLANGAGSSITINKNDALKISWSSSNTWSSGYPSCTGSSKLSGSSGTTGSIDKHADTLVSATTTLTYGMTCSNTNGTGSDSVSVRVNVASISTPSLATNGAPTSSSVPLAWTAATTSSPASIKSYTLRNTTTGGSYAITAPTTSFNVTGLSACTTYSLNVYATNNQTTNSGVSNTISVKTVGCPVPTAPVLSSNGSSTSSAIPIKWTASSGGTISGYTVTMRNDAGTVSNFTPSPATATSYTATGLTACKSYTFTTTAQNTDGNAATSGAYSASTTGCPPGIKPPPPPPSGGCGTACGGSTGGGTGTKSGGSTNTNSGGGSGGSTAAPDTTPPDSPDGFTAAATSGATSISLSWSASSDASGIKGYHIERSIDQNQWTTLVDSVSQTTYEDKTTAFNTHYYYKLAAVDNAGNSSAYVFADAETGQFESNAGTTDTTLTSDDKVASVSVPADAIGSGADCSVVPGDATVSLTKDQGLVAGPYQLLCKDADGNQIASIAKAVKWTYTVSATQLKGLKTPNAVVVDDSGKATLAKSTYNSKLRTVSFDQVAGTQTLLVATKKKGLPANLIIGIIFFFLVLGGILIFMLRRGQKANYSDYIRSKYYDI